QVNHRTLVSSDMDVDRIVKESRRTTIVENKEIIFFKRPNRRSQSTPRSTEVSGNGNDSERTILSIRDSRRPSNESLNVEKEKEGGEERLTERRTSDASSRSPSQRVSFHPSTFQPENF
ncbi:hypothetical protein PFISCL1PPCAC_2026, partial [Pristionchus fissidentatus]